MTATAVTSAVHMTDEVSSLIETLMETGQRLEELTGREVDSVSDGHGRTFILRHAQEQLRDAEAARQAAILDALPGHIALIDSQGVITAVNAAWRSFGEGNMLRDPTFGIGADYLRICDSVEGAGAAEASLVAGGIRSVLAGTATTFSCEYSCHSPLERRWFHLTVTPLAADRRNGAVVMHWAITERKQADRAREALAKETERRERILSATLSSITDFAYIFDGEGRFLFVNQPLLALWGIKLDAAVGRNFHDLGYPVELATRLQQEVQDVFRTGRNVTGETPYISPTGVARFYEYIFSPDMAVDGTVRFVAGSTRDVTERKAHEKHLALMESRYRGLLEAAPDAMVVVGDRGEIVLVNVQAEKQFGYRRDELLGQQVTNIIPEGFAERIIADGTRSAAEALAQQIGTGIELSARRKDGTAFPIEIMLSPLESAEGVLVTVAIRDISARKVAEELLLQKVAELRSSNEELEHFAYVASHDLQEPLRMVASYTQLLSRRYTGKLDADADEFIAFAVDGARRMQRLIQDLLTYSRVGRKGGELRTTSSVHSLEEALVNLRLAIGESGAIITHGALPNVLADEVQLVQLFQNLVGNAIKYRGESAPEIDVSAARRGSGWTFLVRDNGMGMESKYFERIFGMFQRLHGRNEYAGTGIGLAICKKIVERHGGTIGVESAPGMGSTFRFELKESEIND